MARVAATASPAAKRARRTERKPIGLRGLYPLESRKPRHLLPQRVDAESPVVIGEQDVLAVVPPLGDVMGHPRDDDSGDSRHAYDSTDFHDSVDCPDMATSCPAPS